MIDQDDRQALASVGILTLMAVCGVLLGTLTLAVAYRLFQFVIGV